MHKATCPVCKNGLENVICCPRCMTPMHTDCGALMGGKCATLYCEDSTKPSQGAAVLPSGSPSRFTALLERLLVIAPAPTPSEDRADGEYGKIVNELIEMAPEFDRREARRRLEETYPFLRKDPLPMPAREDVEGYQKILQRVQGYLVSPNGWQRFRSIFDKDLFRKTCPEVGISPHISSLDPSPVMASIEGYDRLTQARVISEIVRRHPLEGVEALDQIRFALYENVVKDLFAVGRYDDAITVAHESADLTLHRKVTYAAGKHYLDQGLMSNKAWEAFFKGGHYEEALEAAFQPPGLTFIHYQEIYHAHVEASDLPKPVAEVLFAQYFHRRIQQLSHGNSINVFGDWAAKKRVKAYEYLEKRNDLTGLLDLARECDDAAKVIEVTQRLEEFRERQSRLEHETPSTVSSNTGPYLLSGAKKQLPE